MPPLSWRNLSDTVIYTAERLHCLDIQRLKAAAVIHTLASKCGNDAFLSILRGLVQAALAARNRDKRPNEVATETKAWVLQTSSLLKQIAQV